jgi:DNA replication ATP-dependent helicase Dna2
MNPAPQLYEALQRIAAHPDWTPVEQTGALAALMDRLYLEATRKEQIAFSTLFARICYVGHQRGFQTDTLQVVHAFRRRSAQIRSGRAATLTDVRLGVKAVAESILVLYEAALPPNLLPYLPSQDEWVPENPDILTFKALARVVVLGDDPDARTLIGIDEEHPTDTVRICYDLPDRNDNFRPTITLLRSVFGYPTTIHLLDVDVDSEGRYRPRAFVLEPDYLIDVSAISECFKDTGPEPLSYLLRKFLPHETTPAILLGNIANHFLDRLLYEPEAEFQDLFRETFVLWPFVYAPMNDQEVKNLYEQAKAHYITLRDMTRRGGGLERQQITPQESIVEPSFYSQRYGIQGRLDLFFKNEERAAIVELKSGKPFKPNIYGINRNHFTQTLLYDLLVRSVYGRHTDPAKFILYSSQPDKPLCFAPTIEAEQWEAIQVRNQLVGIERLLCRIRPGDTDVPILNRLTSAHLVNKGFMGRDAAVFEEKYQRLGMVERKYFNAFTGFIAREQWIAKVGEHGADQTSGHAQLWRSSFEEKEAAYAVLNHLRLIENGADQPDPYLLFERTEQTNPLANFRVGDIAVLYPATDRLTNVLDQQVIKCIITSLTTNEVRVQLRFRQFHQGHFDVALLWRLEPDMMEMGFTAMYRGLFERPSLGPKAPTDTAQKPQKTADWAAKAHHEGRVTEEQAELLTRITESQQYFLLWGPPGTGKTSVMIRELAGWGLEHTNDNLLLLAYTNRAVDEICEALDSLGGSIRDQYVRIGSRYSTAAHLRPQLLAHKTANVTTRADLRQVLEQHRIFVGTVASFSQNDQLLRIKRFERLIIDEASQILEPQLTGLLSRFGHWVLVGDHRQLPAVTTQRPEWTAVEDPDLIDAGLRDLRESYFERLYRQCEAHQDEAHFGRLSAQGRMRREIMDFPNQHFYGGFLKVLATSAAAQDLGDPAMAIRYVPTPPDPHRMPHQKTDRQEAILAAEWVQIFQRQWQEQHRAWDAQRTLGIITPWRAQIAQLRAALAEHDVDPDSVTIDTVERYQGGARDIIIVSTCVHSEWQLQSLVSRSAEGVDRKLNVALTRARQHLILLGHPDVLRLDPHYQAFMEAYGPTE